MTGLTIDYWRLLPALLPVAGVVAVLVLDLVTPRLRRAPYAIALVAALGAAAATVPGLRLGAGETLSTLCLSGAASDLPAVPGLPQTCFWQAGALGSTLQLAAASAAAVTIVLGWPWAGGRVRDEYTGTVSPERRTDGSGNEPIEAVLLLTALTGAIVVAASRDMGTWLIALELATLPIIALIALSGTRAAVAGSVQLLMTSLVSFAILTLGVAFWFAASGSPFFTAGAAIAAESTQGGRGVLALGVILILTGVGFKLSLVPFHAWTPTAYAGSRTAVAAFLATVSKLGGLAALLVVLQALTAIGPAALIVIAVLSIASMTLGNLMALRQDDVVRLLAWSTVAQAGWVVLPLVSMSTGGDRAAATYLLTYVVATLVAFSVVGMTVREQPSRGRTLTAYTGLWQRSPWRAGALALALTSLAGLPPGVIGLVGKVAALRPVVSEGWIWLAVIAAANAVLGVAVYTRWLRPVITTGTPAGVLAPSMREVTVEAETSEVEEGAPTRPVGPGARLTLVHRPLDRAALMLALVIATVVLVAVSVQPDLLLGLLG